MGEPLQFIIVIGFGALWLRLSHRVHRHTQQMARRNDQAWGRPLQLDDRQMGMGRAAKRIEILSAATRYCQLCNLSCGQAFISKPSRNPQQGGL